MIQFYRKLNPQTGVSDFYEVGTNRHIGPTEFGRGENFQEVKSPDQPAVTRDETGNIATLTNPLEDWKNQTVFMQTAKDIIKRKQRMNEDIQESKRYWKTLIRDTSPFGGARTPESQIEGAFTDERFRELSPTDQASIRASRLGAGMAHLEGLGEEQVYRETQTKDTLQVLKDMWAEKEKLAQQEIEASRETRAKEAHKLDMKKTKLEIQKLSKEIGYQIDEDGNVIADVSGATAQDIVDAMKEIESGGDYNRRPVNGDEYGAYQFRPATWDSWSQEYLKSIKGPAMSLEMTPENQDRVALFKVQQWMSKPYNFTPEQIAAAWNAGPGIVENDKWKTHRGINEFGVKYDVPAHVNRFRNVLATKVSTPGEVPVLTEAIKAGLRQKAGLSTTDVKDYSEDDWIMLKQTIRESNIEDAYSKLTGMDKNPATGIWSKTKTGWVEKMTYRGKTVTAPKPETFRARLIDEYGEILTTDEIDAIMNMAGYARDISGVWTPTGD